MAILRSLIRPSLIGLQTKLIGVPTIELLAVSTLKIHLNQRLSLLHLPRPRLISVYIHRMAECPCICSCRCSWRRLPRKPLHPAAVCMGRGRGEGKGGGGYKGHQITGTTSTDYFKHLLVLSILIKAAITAHIQLQGVHVIK